MAIAETEIPGSLARPNQAAGVADTGVGLPLSVRLKQSVAAIHDEIEAGAAIPDGILSLADYALCLGRFHAVFAPVEECLAAFDDWPEWGIDLAAHVRTPALRADLAALGFDHAALPRLVLPPMADFAAALGGLYVLEGSSLGGKVILRSLEARLGSRLAGAAAFFGGAGRQGALAWPAFKARLDCFGEGRPAAQARAIAGAMAVFRHFAAALRSGRR
jgi:heme oxygenase